MIDGDDGHFVFFPNIMSQCPFLLMSPSTLLSVFSAESARCQLNRWGFSRLWHLLGSTTSSKITLPSQQQHPAKCGALSLLLRVFHRSKIHHLYPITNCNLFALIELTTPLIVCLVSFSSFSILPPITTIIINHYHFFEFIQPKCTNACLRLFKQMRGQLALTSLVSTRSSKIALFSRQTEVV